MKRFRYFAWIDPSARMVMGTANDGRHDLPQYKVHFYSMHDWPFYHEYCWMTDISKETIQSALRAFRDEVIAHRTKTE